MDFGLTDEQSMLVETVREFVRKKIQPLEEELDPDASELDPETFARLSAETKRMGLHNLGVPAELGGPGVDTVTRSLLMMELAQHRAGLYSPCYDVFGYVWGPAQIFEANEDQRKRFLEPTLRGEKGVFFALTEPTGGSDPGRMIRTTAVQDGDDWVINGSKVFISHADRAAYGLVFARTGTLESGRDGITCFIVETDTPGFHVQRVIHSLRAGHYATELRFDDVRVPSANILGELNSGFTIANDHLSRNRIVYSAACVGVALRAHELALDYTKLREVFGKTLAEHEGIQWMLVDNEIDLRTAALHVLNAASAADRGVPFRTAAATAKITATEAAARVVDRSMQVHGGYGVTKDFPFERWYRELRIRRIGEGTTETQRMIISRDLQHRRDVKLFS